MNKSQRFTVPLAIVLALAITPTLSGCFGNPIEQIVEGATGGDVSLPGQGLPDDFPAEVPLIDGEVVFGMGMGDAGAKAWNVTVRVAGLEAADTIKAELEGAGFTPNEAGIGGTAEGTTSLLYESAAYTVLVVVTSDSDKGFVANYTVTDKAS